MRNRMMKPLVVSFFYVLMSGCGGCADDPGLAGEACDPSDSEACVEGLACLKNDDGKDVCLIPARGSCDPDAEQAHCQGGTECFTLEDESSQCLIPVGGDCNPASDPTHCEAGAACYEHEDGGGHCLMDFGGSCSMEDPRCAPDLVCAEVTGGAPSCFNDVVLSGFVFDSESLDAIADAHIIAFNEEGTAVTDVSISREDGTYDLSLPVTRDEDGAPTRQFFTLRAAAQDYQTFPGGIRTALPIDASTAADEDGRWAISTVQTEISLILLADSAQGLPSISGAILADTRRAGVLVVAEGGDHGYSAVSDLHGHYTIFNVPAGSYSVRGYAAGVQLTPEPATVAGEPIVDVDLSESADSVTTVSGQIQIVAAPGGSQTSVVFVVESTFDEVSVRGEVPSGLRAPLTGAPDITGAWEIRGVPAGDYVVLAGFENDSLVRDPDEGIAGTGIVRITVEAGEATQTIGQSFKVTAALATVAPGMDTPEKVTEKPMLIWGPSSNAEHYAVLVFNAYGEIVWSDDNVARTTAGANVTRQYEGPLEDGMYYQFRATSWRRDSPSSNTEVLRGVFYKE